jgi:hypothetical protein
MKTDKAGKVDLQEFAAFLTAEPAIPLRATDEAVFRLVEKSMRPFLWAVLGKLTLVEAAAGLGTLAFCPQFDIGFGSHSESLHFLHTWGPLLHYFACGIFFVLLGAVLAGMLLHRDELYVLGKSKHLYFVVYSLTAYAIFIAFGAEAFLLGSLFWISGAVLGNYLGFIWGTRLRTVIT